MYFRSTILLKHDINFVRFEDNYCEYKHFGLMGCEPFSYINM
jgi:hypothetical protein